jgi:hypothetical protein
MNYAFRRTGNLEVDTVQAGGEGGGGRRLLGALVDLTLAVGSCGPGPKEQPGTETDGATKPPPVAVEPVHIVGEGDVLAPAQAALNAGDVDRAISLFFVSPSTSERREQPDAKRLLAAIQKASDLQVGRDPAADFTDRVEHYWMPEMRKASPQTAASDDEIGKARLLFEEAARELEASKQLASTYGLQAAQETLRSTTSAKQRAAFPVWRRTYAERVGKRLWSRDITVKLLGGGRTVEFVGGMFAANANIGTFHQGMKADLRALRFDEASYRWLPDADGWTYKLDTPTDGELGYWDGEKFVTVR